MTDQRRLLTTLTVASLLIYPSRRQTPADDHARRIIAVDIKQAQATVLERVALRLGQLDSGHPVRQVIPDDVVLVPVPRHAPQEPKSLWPALQIARALHAAGIGAAVSPLLQRTAPIGRSTGARTAAERPTPMRHFITIHSDTALGLSSARGPHVLVDDVVTTGATLIARASRLAAIAPDEPITAFAVAPAERFVSLTAATEMFAPYVERVHLRTTVDGNAADATLAPGSSPPIRVAAP